MLNTVSTLHLGNTFEETCIMWKIVLGFVVFAALSLFVIFKSCDSFKLFGNSKPRPPSPLVAPD